MFLRYREPIFLASQSPRRQQLLSQIGVEFELLAVEIDESIFVGEKPLEYVQRMAGSKARTAWSSQQIKKIDHYYERALLAADTSVVLGERVLGKPASFFESRQMLEDLSAMTHRVITCVALVNKDGINIQTSITEVTFAKLSQKTIQDYCELGEGMDKAGSYAIQGAAALFVRSMKGSYSGVVGLPLYETGLLLDAHFEAACLSKQKKGV